MALNLTPFGTFNQLPNGTLDMVLFFIASFPRSARKIKMSNEIRWIG